MDLWYIHSEGNISHTNWKSLWRLETDNLVSQGISISKIWLFHHLFSAFCSENIWYHWYSTQIRTNMKELLNCDSESLRSGEHNKKRVTKFLAYFSLKCSIQSWKEKVTPPPTHTLKDFKNYTIKSIISFRIKQ